MIPQGQPLPQPIPISGELHLTFSGPVEDVTATRLMQQLDMILNPTVTGIYISMSTPGGSVNAGVMLHNYLRALPVPVTIHNIGQVDSIGNVVFLAGDKRYASPATSFLYHGVTMTVNKNDRITKSQLKEVMSQLEQDEKRIAAVITERTKITKAQLTKFFEAGQALGPDEAVKFGVIDEIREATHPQGTVRAFFNSFPPPPNGPQN